jgi:uncharacterized membrane protein
MDARDTLVAEVGAAVAILGLLLVFLPLFLDAVAKAAGSQTTPIGAVQLRELLSWAVPATMVVSAASVTTGLLTLWGTAALGKETALLLTATVWLVVLLAVSAVMKAS